MSDVSEIVKELELHRVLRYLVSGSLFVFACHRGDNLPEGWISLSDTMWDDVAVALVAGIVIYAIHRAFFFPIPSRYTQLVTFNCPKEWDQWKVWKNWRRWKCWKSWKSWKRWKEFLRIVWPYTVLEREILFTRTRWKRGGQAGRVRAEQSALNEWAGQIHLMFCCGHALLLGNFLSVGLTNRFDPPLAWTIGILYLGGIVANLRYLRHVDTRAIKRFLMICRTRSARQAPVSRETASGAGGSGR